MPAPTARRYADKSAAERHDDRRARLLEAALDAFGTEGYAAVTIEQLCGRASISTRSFYELFRSREEVLIALHDQLNARALTAVVESIAAIDGNDLPARARAGARAYFEVMTSDRRWARIAVVESVGVSRAAEEHRQQAIGRFAELLRLEGERLAAEGVIPPRNFRLIAAALVGAFNGLINTWAADPDWAEHVDEVVQVAADMVVAAITGPG